MEQTPLPPLVSDEDVKRIRNAKFSESVPIFEVRDLYEADRLKTREVVQALVDKAHHSSKCEYLYESNCDCGLTAALALASSKGFTPTQR